VNANPALPILAEMVVRDLLVVLDGHFGIKSLPLSLVVVFVGVPSRRKREPQIREISIVCALSEKLPKHNCN
jgi:hypothetical protein